MRFFECKTYVDDLNKSIASTVSIEKLKYKTVLVTGVTGTIGSFIVDMLIQYNKQGAAIKIIAAGRNVDKIKKIYEGLVSSEELQIVQYDLSKNIEFDIDVDYIIHAAGNAHPVAFNSDPVGTIIGNINSTYNLLEYGKCHKASRFCYISSGEIYGQGDLSLDSYDENYAGYLDNCMPRSCYPISKRAVENLCASYYKQYGMETIIVRPCHTYGPRITDTDSRANVQFMKCVLQDKDIVLTSPGLQLRSYCYIADCAAAILTCMLNGKAGEAYNSANKESRVTIAEFAKVIADLSGKKVVFSVPDETDLSNRTPIAKQVLSSDKLEKLGWKGNYSVELGVKHTLDILRDCN